MSLHKFTWGRHYVRLASEAFRRKILKEKVSRKSILPEFAMMSFLEWVRAVRPIVDGKPRNFFAIPFWEEIYKDGHPYIMIVAGRQTHKSTYATDLIADEATRTASVQVCYITHSQNSQTAFSRQRLKIGTFFQNPTLSKFLRHKQGNVGEISLKNDSTIYITHDGNMYKNVEGKSLNLCILDEAQYQDMGHAERVVQTMMATKGKLIILGIGGELGSPYHKYWENSDQREWIFDDPNWRSKLQFDENGLVIGEYLKDVMKGQWVPQKPENTMCHGYHLPQTIFAIIPLTMEDAVRYKVSPMYSIEYQQKNNTASVFASHVMGKFYKSVGRPVTQEMVLSCMNPYRYLGLMKPQEIAEWKDVMGEKIKIAMGVDFGSGKSSASSTVVVILIEWTTIDGQKRWHLAYLDKRPSENQIDQAEYLCNLFHAARCDVGIGDLGYGVNQVKIIQDGGHNRHTGQPFPGVGSNQFKGCRTISDESKPVQTFNETTDEHGDKTGRVDIDKTTAIQEFIDMLGVFVVHPLRPQEQQLRRPKLMIPSKNDTEVDWLIKDCTNITRKDLNDIVNVVDPRQKAKKEFNHPADSVMAIIYAMKALEINPRWIIF